LSLHDALPISDASQNQQESPQDNLNKRLEELESRKQDEAQEETVVPKEEQPEVQPDLKTEEEAAASEDITKTFAEANTNVTDVEANDPAETPVTAHTEETEPTAAGSETGPENQEASSSPSVVSATATPSHEHEDEELEDEEDHTDYSLLSLEELRAQLATILKSADSRKRFKVINELQRHYETKFQTERAEALEKFKQEGGTAEDFEYHTTPEHQDLEKLLTAYREARYQERQNTEKQRQQNLEHKRELLAQLRQLVESAETKNSSDELKKLQADWKNT